MPCPNPELLMVSVNTKSTLWWESGMNASTRTITVTPNTCQNTEMLLNSATSGEEKMLISACSVRITTKSRNVSLMMCAVSPQSAKPRFSPYSDSVALRNCAHPKSTDATTPTRPTQLNQPVNQPHFGPPSIEAQ